MPKKMLIDATHAEETRVVVVDGNKVEEFDFESENKRQLAGNIYLAKVSRVEPSLQAAFVEYGGNRHGFLAFSEIHPDYYQIPVADREALLAEERAYDAQQAEEDEKPKSSSRSRSRSRGRSRSQSEKIKSDDAVQSREAANDDIPGMGVIDLGDENYNQSDDQDTRDDAPEVTQPVAPDAIDEPQPQIANADHDKDAGADRDLVHDASDRDDEIESVAEEDVAEEIRAPRKPRPRRYKIQEVVKVRQIMLVQVVKEERGNKGAALTTYLSLAGRYCVLMPNTARGGGISRKITNAPDRKKLKEIANEIDVPLGAGLIIRTAGAKRTKAEIKRDYEYLQRMWEQIRELTLKSIAPAKIYEEGDLIKRSIRDLYNRDIDEVFVEGEMGYRTAKDFMKMIMPSHAKNVKHYADSQPLFARYQVESYLSSMFNPTVQLKSGGYIVIGVTEALVAIDVNSGRATKENSIEETATKTNLEAAEEVARQLRLRDLAGLIVIDFIDMEDRRNNAKVEKLFKDKLKTDRARIQVGRISGFGLMEMSRQRLRPGMIEATTQPCPACHGTGLVRSDDNLALNILRQLEEEGGRKRSREVLLKAPVGIVNFLMNSKREHVAQIEARYDMAVRIEADPFLISPDFSIEKFKTATRAVPAVPAHVISTNASLMPDLEEEDDVEIGEEIEEAAEVSPDPESDGNGGPKKRRRRRRRRGRSGSSDRSDDSNGSEAQSADTPSENQAAPEQNAPVAAEAGEADSGGLVDVPETGERAKSAEAKKPTRSRSRAKKPAKDADTDATETDAKADKAEVPATAEAEVTEKPKRTRAPRSRKKPEATVVADPAQVPEETPAAPATAAREPVADAPAPKTKTNSKPAVETPAPKAKPTPEPEPAMAEADTKPKKRGWWSLGR